MSAREFLDSYCKNDNFCFHYNKPKFQRSLWWCANRRVIFVWEILWTNGKSLTNFQIWKIKWAKSRMFFAERWQRKTSNDFQTLLTISTITKKKENTQKKIIQTVKLICTSSIMKERDIERWPWATIAWIKN